MNGQVNGNTRTKNEQVFRSHDRPTISAPEFAAMQRGYLERLGTIVEQLSTITRLPNTPTAVTDLRSADATRTGCVSTHNIPLSNLIRRPLGDGMIGYSLPTSLLRSIVDKLIGANRLAFVIHQAGTRSGSLEIVGTSDREISAAINFAAQQWSTDQVVIHADGNAVRRVVEHAVAHNLRIGNRDPYMQSLVRAAREASTRRRLALIERVPADESPL